MSVRTLLYVLLGIIMIGIIFPDKAAAHITANPNESEADSWFRTALRVSHGCAGAATIAVKVKIPPGPISVRPQAKPGWAIEIKMRQLEPPIHGPHGLVTEVADEITWRGGPLPDAYFDEFGLSMRLPNEPGKILYFPTIQECEKGTEYWVEIPATGEAWGDKDKPAPYIRLKPAAMDGHAHH